MHGGQPGFPSWSATRAALAGHHHRCGDDGGREPAGSQRLESDVSEVEVVATWAGVVRVVAIRRPVEVLLGIMKKLWALLTLVGHGAGCGAFCFRSPARR